MSVALTRSRCINALRCYASYALSRLGSVRFVHSKPYTIHHTPLFVSVEPASVCQLRCPACPVGLRNLEISSSRDLDRTMSLEVFRRVLSEIRDTAWVMQFYFQGEPLLNKDLPQMIREAHDAGLYTIVSTNAQALTETLAEQLVASGLDRIIISMDGLTDESYSAYRIGGSLDKTKAAIRYLREAKSVCQRSGLSAKRSVSKTVCVTPGSGLIVELQVIRLRSNEHEWAEFRRVYKSLGADKLTFKTAQLYDYADGHPLMPSDPKYSRYIVGKDGQYHRRALGKGCWRVWSGVVVTTNGDVLPCCYDKAHAHAYGNIMNTRMRDLFINDKAMSFRKAAFQEQPKICQECYR